MTTLQFFTDGGSRGNPGPAAAAYVVFKEGKLIAKGSKYLGEKTNNFAEYSAVIIALEWLVDNLSIYKPKSVDFTLDSELVVKQLTKIYRVKDSGIKILYDKTNKLIKSIPCDFSFKAVKRDKNKDADALVNVTLDELAP